MIFIDLGIIILTSFIFFGAVKTMNKICLFMVVHSDIIGSYDIGIIMKLKDDLVI